MINLGSTLVDQLVERMRKDGWTEARVMRTLKDTGWNEHQARDVLSAVQLQLELGASSDAS